VIKAADIQQTWFPANQNHANINPTEHPLEIKMEMGMIAQNPDAIFKTMILE